MSNKNKIIIALIVALGLLAGSTAVYYPKYGGKLFKAINPAKPPIIFKPLAGLKMEVDVSKTIGAMPTVLKPGMLDCLWHGVNAIEAEIKDIQQKPSYRLCSVLNSMTNFGDETKPENFDTKLINSIKEFVAPSLRKYQDSGNKLIINVNSVPRWLALYPSKDAIPSSDIAISKWSVSPMKDYNEWKNLLKIFVSTLKDEGISADYIIGDEPDWMFYGTEEQYLEYYKNSVLAIKDVDKNIQVGGPGVSNWERKKVGNCPAEATGLEDGECPKKDHTMIEALIEYVGENKLPLDFIDWHFPAISQIKQQVSETRNWLKKAGLPENTRLTIGEWVYSQKKENESTESAAAYVVKLLKTFEENGIYRHTATSLYDQAGWISGEWQHVGFFSAKNDKLIGVIKPKWNTVKVIDKLISNSSRLDVSLEENDYVTALASQTQDKKTNRILLSNFVPSGEMLRGVLLVESRSSMIEKRGYSEEECKLIITALKEAAKKSKGTKGVATKDHITSVIDQTDFPDPLNDEKVKKDLKSVLSNEVDAKFKEIEYYAKNQRTIDLSVNLPAGSYTQKRYIIDKDHSNSCRYNKKTESKPSNTECGIEGEIDRKVALAKEESEAEAKKVAFEYLKSKNYTKNDINAITKVAQACKMNKKCIGTQLEKDYSKLERCRLDPKKTYIAKPCPTSEFVKLEFAEAYKRFTTTRDQVFYYDSKNSIDKINNMKGVALESVNGTNVSVKQSFPYQEKFKMEPNSVLLIEFVITNK